MREEYKTFIGIADCDGLDSLIPEEAKPNVCHLEFRVRMNAHRHPVVYKTILKESDADTLTELFNTEKYKEALEFIKTHAIYVGAVGRDAQATWDSIPFYPSQPRAHSAKKNLQIIDIKQLNLNFEEE